MKILTLLFFFCLCLLSTGFAQTTSSLWTEIEEADLIALPNRPTRVVSPEAYKTLRLDADALKQVLTSAPSETSGGTAQSEPFDVLMPDGKTKAFYLVEYSMMEPALADKFPSMKTYHGYGVTDPSHRIRLDWTGNGLHAMLLLPDGLAYIKPYAQGDKEHYLSYYERDMPAETAPFECGTIEEKILEPEQGNQAARAGDCQLRRYRLAIAATGEYTTNTLGASSAGNAADDALVTSHMVTNVNQMNGWYERDITARFILIGNLTDIFYYNGATDPYTNSSSTTMLGENITNLSATIGNSNFDIGHVLGNSGGSSGVAGLNVLCGTSKARGVTRASASGINQPRFLKVLSHELGHQFGAGHTQNEDCQRMSASAMEPGAGTTIMSYVTSACANQIQSVPDYYFHAISIQQMSARMLSTSCATILPSTNSAPTVSAGLDKSVPTSTPLLLSAAASDPDGDPLTYTWEQFDNEVATAIPPQPTNTQGPNFRSFPPTSESGRYLPNLTAVLNGTTPTWEVIPSVARNMEFKVTVRDNSTNSISCTDEDNIVITSAAGGPFSVTTASSPGTIWFEGLTETVNWNVAGTNSAPVSCSNVDILLSYDGGLTFPTTLASGVTNNGSASVIVPLGPTTNARVLVRCLDNIFYNVSEEEFEIQVPASPTFLLSLPTPAAAVCPGAIASVPVSTQSVAGFTGNISLSASNVPAGAGANFANATIPVGTSTNLSINTTSGLAPGDYTITITGTSGPIVRTADFVLTIEEPPGLTTLDEPVANAIDVSLLPTLTWTPTSNATSYELQLSPDQGFATLLVDETVASPTYMLTTSLAALNTYYWRARTTTTCGVTPWSAAREFTTINCLPSFTQNTPVNIPASGTPTVTSVITISQPGTVEEISVTNIQGVHTWTADLDVDLIGPRGTPIVRLFSDLCGGGDDFDISLSDDALTGVASALCNPLGRGGTFIPEEPLSAFFGEPIAGNWTLRISDDANQDGGSLNSWSIDFCSSSSVPLPVEMISFDATAVDNAIHLNWKTASETNNAGFSIERRSAFDSDFRQLGQVAAADNIQAINDYDYVDADVKPGARYYYRLRQNDLDGKFAYSEVRTASIEATSKGLQVYPNPVRGELTGFLNVETNTESEISLLDLSGRVVQAQTVTGSQFVMNMTALPSGIYVLKARHSGGEEIVKLMVN